MLSISQFSVVEDFADKGSPLAGLLVEMVHGLP